MVDETLMDLPRLTPIMTDVTLTMIDTNPTTGDLTRMADLHPHLIHTIGDLTMIPTGNSPSGDD